MGFLNHFCPTVEQELFPPSGGHSEGIIRALLCLWLVAPLLLLACCCGHFCCYKIVSDLILYPRKILFPTLWFYYTAEYIPAMSLRIKLWCMVSQLSRPMHACLWRVPAIFFMETFRYGDGDGLGDVHTTADRLGLFGWMAWRTWIWWEMHFKSFLV